MFNLGSGKSKVPPNVFQEDLAERVDELFCEILGWFFMILFHELVNNVT